MQEAALKVLDDAIERHDPKHVIALFSGGHDSLVATHIASRHPRFSFALHINTGIGIEETRQFVRNTCATWGIELREYSAAANANAHGALDPQHYENLVLDQGFPGPPLHTKMFNRLKERPLRHALRDLERVRSDRTVLVSGIRQQESLRRMRHTQAEQVWERTKIWVAPIFAFGKTDVYDYMATHGLSRNEVVDKIHKSGECLCGAFAKPGELAELELWFPETARYIKQLETRVKAAGFPWGWEESVPKWYLENKRGQMFLPGTEPEGVMCSSCIQGEEPVDEIR